MANDRPRKILVKMRDRDWDDLDDLVELNGSPSRSEAMRAAVRSELRRLRKERDDREAAAASKAAFLQRLEASTDGP